MTFSWLPWLMETFILFFFFFLNGDPSSHLETTIIPYLSIGTLKSGIAILNLYILPTCWFFMLSRCLNTNVIQLLNKNEHYLIQRRYIRILPEKQTKVSIYLYMGKNRKRQRERILKIDSYNCGGSWQVKNLQGRRVGWRPRRKMLLQLDLKTL